MTQLKLFDIELPKKPVNVASVVQRSPFRYPGGKTWFVPYARKWLKQFDAQVEYIEPFAGGGIVGLTCAFENLAKTVLLVEKDEDVAAVWQTMLGNHGNWLAEKVLSFELTPSNVAKELSKPAKSLRQRAFVTFLKNRLHHGGILADGAGLIKNGENGKGLRSRWYPRTLHNRIKDIIEIKDNIKFHAGDGMKVIEKNLQRTDVVFFVDPPYTKASRRLYKYYELDHDCLFNLLSRTKGDFLLTYDEAYEIEQLANRYNFEVEKVLMKTTLHYQKFELVIGRDLKWLRAMLDE